MWKFIITWCLAMTVIDPCPDAGRIDEFGRELTSVCLVYHYHTEYDCRHYREFFNRDSAFKFYDNAKREAMGWSHERLDSVKIDSIRI